MEIIIKTGYNIAIQLYLILYVFINFIKTDSDINKNPNTVAHADPITPYIGINTIFKVIVVTAPIALNTGIQFVILFI